MNRCKHTRLRKRIVPHVGTLYRCADCDKKIADHIATKMSRVGKSALKRTNSKIAEAATIIETIIEMCNANCPEHGTRER